ncbi:anhydro-N-acetylmuramic acid kinase [Ornithinimicrobium pekingense]|uniref:Anhydro-N-acetylmuramic acid kinase n=1 Tax=Ornithinimicrobium pekingense TaxID=384677 RepID=A0ABQ2F4I1_9MICO|nr:anhydro-N-acetylmuramic acid kinase [Ornithinimicrobium pekingense]GGK60454.1 anhydro-N-acetylmuramic acid kinase [Ornithinimicrobium pekingense]
MIVLGMGSGTSVDGVDVAVLELGLVDGTVEARVLGTRSHPYDPALRSAVLAAFPPGRVGMQEVCRLDTRLGQAFAEAAVATARAVLGDRPVDLAASHGQTVFHDVVEGRVAGTLQLGQPAWIAEATGAPVVSDLRVADVAAGGQGAPLASTWDALWLGGTLRTRVALNLGGIANVTVVPPSGPLVAFDTGPANALVDAVVGWRTGAALDRDGALASSGTVDDELLALLLDDPYYSLEPPKTTGKEHYNLGLVQRALQRLGRDVGTADLVATVTELTAVTVAGAVTGFRPAEVVVSGGGASNPALLARLRVALDPAGTELVTSDAYGVPPDDKEACLFALLGFLTWHGLPGTHPAGTGARVGRISGRITPGHGPLRMPEPARTTPRALRLLG